MTGPARNLAALQAAIAFSLAMGTQAAAQESPCEGAADRAVAALTGVVRDAGMAIVLPGVRVMAVWSGGQVETVSDEGGAFRLCELPVGVPVTAVASLAGLSGSPQQLQLEAGDEAALDLSIDFMGGADPVAETGRIVAYVRDALSGSPHSWSHSFLPAAGEGIPVYQGPGMEVATCVRA